MSDPNALLSTLSQSSAAMVAIIGGFLVSKLVAISSEREALKRQLKVAKQNVVRAKADYEPAYQYRLANSKSAFYDFTIDKLVEAEADEVDHEKLVSENVPRGSSLDEMMPYAKELDGRVKNAFRKIIEKLENGDQRDIDLEELKKRGLKIPEADEDIYEQVLYHISTKLSPKTDSFGMTVPTLSVGPITPAWRQEVEARRLDESISEEGRLKGQLASHEHEVERVKVDLNKLGKPVGVVQAVVILSFLSLSGIVIPVVVMASEPIMLSMFTKILLVGLFSIGLASVLGYIVWYLKKIAA